VESIFHKHFCKLKENGPQICADFVTQMNADRKSKELRAKSEELRAGNPMPYALCSRKSAKICVGISGLFIHTEDTS